MFFTKKITWDDVIEFLKNNQLEIDNNKAELIIEIVAKSRSNKVITFKVESDDIR